MKKIVSLIALGKPMEDLGEEIMEVKDIPPVGSLIPLDEGDEALFVKFKVENEEEKKVNLYGELTAIQLVDLSTIKKQ